MREVYLPAYSVGDDTIASSGSAFRRLGQNGSLSAAIMLWMRQANPCETR